MKKPVAIVLVLFLVLSGCSTTGPSRKEKEQAQELTLGTTIMCKGVENPKYRLVGYARWYYEGQELKHWFSIKPTKNMNILFDMKGADFFIYDSKNNLISYGESGYKEPCSIKVESGQTYFILLVSILDCSITAYNKEEFFAKIEMERLERIRLRDETDRNFGVLGVVPMSHAKDGKLQIGGIYRLASFIKYVNVKNSSNTFGDFNEYEIKGLDKVKYKDYEIIGWINEVGKHNGYIVKYLGTDEVITVAGLRKVIWVFELIGVNEYYYVPETAENYYRAFYLHSPKELYKRYGL